MGFEGHCLCYPFIFFILNRLAIELVVDFTDDSCAFYDTIYVSNFDRKENNTGKKPDIDLLGIVLRIYGSHFFDLVFFFESFFICS